MDEGWFGRFDWSSLLGFFFRSGFLSGLGGFSLFLFLGKG